MLSGSELSFSILAQGHRGQSYSVADLFGLTEGWRPPKMVYVGGVVRKLQMGACLSLASPVI